MLRFIVLFGFMLCLSISSNAKKEQVTKQVKAEYTYTSENMDESPNQAVQKAFLYARQEALKKVFGEKVIGITKYIAQNDNGQESVLFYMESGTIQRADWLKTNKEEIISRSWNDNGFMVFTVFVEGMVREIAKVGIDLEYDVLKNGERIGGNEYFHNRDLINVTFKAPTDGYLAIYLTDDKKAYCMLPYEEQKDGIYRISKDQQYIFFSKDHALSTEKSYKLQRRLETKKEREVNTLYIIFSQNHFTKRVDEPGKRNGGKSKSVRYVELNKFQDWLYKCQQRDDQMKVEKKAIIITKN